ncbi:MAG: exodeoxyribonuclease VII small subunit [Firmicutes bacterium]|nr:exodeoxyribonuclease VII small subunit [Candidatus Colimorpha enterica]
MDKPMTFEEAMAELEKIVSALDNGEMPLDKSLEAFEKGIGLVRLCEEKLTEAEQKVTALTMKEGELHEQPFSSPEQ